MTEEEQAYLDSLEGSSYENFDALYWTTLSINEWRNEWYEDKGFDKPEQVDFRDWDEVRDWFISQESHHFQQTMGADNALGVEAGETRGFIMAGAVDEAAGVADTQVYDPERFSGQTSEGRSRMGFAERSAEQTEYDWMLDLWERQVKERSEFMASAAVLPGEPDPQRSENWTYTTEENGMTIGGDRQEFIGAARPGSFMATPIPLPIQHGNRQLSLSPEDALKEAMIFVGTGLIFNPLIARLGPSVGRIFGQARQGLRTATSSFSERYVSNRFANAIVSTSGDDVALQASNALRVLNLGDEISYQAVSMSLTDDLLRLNAINQGEAALIRNVARMRPEVADGWLIKMNADPQAFRQAAQRVDDALSMVDDASYQAFNLTDDAMNIADDVVDDVMAGTAGWSDDVTARFTPAAVERQAQLAASPVNHPLYPSSTVTREQLEQTAKALGVQVDDVIATTPLKQRVFEANVARQQQGLPIISYSTQGEIAASRLPVPYQSRSPAVIERPGQAVVPYQSRVPAVIERQTMRSRTGAGGANPLPLNVSRFSNWLRRGDSSTAFGAIRQQAANFIDDSIGAINANAIWQGLSPRQRGALAAVGVTTALELGEMLSDLVSGDGSETSEASEGSVPSSDQASGDQAQIELDAWVIDQRTDTEATEHFIRAISQLDSTTLGSRGRAAALQESLANDGSIRTGSLHASDIRSKWNGYWTDVNNNWDAIVANEELYSIVKRLVGEANPEIDLNKEWEVRQFLAYTDSQGSYTTSDAPEESEGETDPDEEISEDLRSQILLEAANIYAADRIERNGPNVSIVGSGDSERFLYQGDMPEIMPDQRQFVTSPDQQLGILENTMFDLFSNGAISHSNAGAQIENISQNQETWETVVRTLYGLGYLRYIGKGNDEPITSAQLQQFIKNPHLYDGSQSGNYSENIINAWANLQFDIEMGYSDRYESLSAEGREDFRINDVLLQDVAGDLVQRAIGENEDSLRSRMSGVDEEMQKILIDDVTEALRNQGYNLEGDGLKRVEDAIKGRLAETFETRLSDSPGTYTERQFAEQILDGFWNMHSIEGETRDLGDSFMLPDWAFGSQGNDIIDLIQLDEFDLLPEACYDAIAQGDLQKARMLVDKDSIKQLHVNHMVSMFPNFQETGMFGDTSLRDMTADDLYMAAMEYAGTIPGSIHYVPDEQGIRELARNVFAEYGGGTEFGEDPMIQELAAEMSEEELEGKDRYYNPDLVGVMNTINQTTGQRRSRGSIFQNR